MKKYFIILLLVLTSCAQSNVTKYRIKSSITNNSFNDFLIELEDYAKNNSYQNIDD